MDIFSLDSIFELIDESKSKIKKDLDMKELEHNKLSLESERLLQVLDYSPKILYEQDFIKTLPVIKLKSQKIETKSPKKNKHVKLVSTPNINIDSFTLNKNNNQISKFDHKLESTEKIKETSEKKEKEEKKEENDDEDDEEFEKRYAQRQRQIEKREQKKKQLNDDEFQLFKTKTSKELNKMNFIEGIDEFNIDNINDVQIKLDVYLFDTNDKINIKITNKENIKDVKQKIFKILLDKNYNLKFKTYEAYSLKIIESEKTINEMNNSLDENLILYDLNPASISFVEKENYNLNKEKLIDNINNIEIKIENIEITINYNINGSLSTKKVKISLEDNLKGILKIFFEQNILEDKNEDLYYFTDIQNTSEIENEIDLNTKIKNLPSYELNLCFKNNINNDEEMLFISDDENKDKKQNEG